MTRHNDEAQPLFRGTRHAPGRYEAHRIGSRRSDEAHDEAHTGNGVTRHTHHPL
jgi:hypothetical protein